MSSLRPQWSVYRLLLKLYPAPYRQQYETEILQTATDMLDEATTRTSKLMIWIRLVADVPVNVARQQLRYAGGVIVHDTPSYVKRNGFISIGLLVPFVLAIVANGLSEALYARSLSGSWLWHSHVLEVWVLYLPIAAFLLAFCTYATYVASRKTLEHISLVKRAFDVYHVWLLLIPIVSAFGILLLLGVHDSIQCWQHSPVYAASHMHEIWQCTVQNQSFKIFVHF